MQTRKRRATAVAGIAVLATLATACGGSSSPSSGGSPSASTGGSGAFKLISQNNTGTPVSGGTLNVLGTSDTDFLDPNITYYSVGYQIVRTFSRQLYSYPAIEGQQTNVVPDLATAMPKISSDGKTYTVTIRSGVKWDTNPPRQVTGADVVRGLKAACNPSQPFGGLPDFNFLLVGYEKFCSGYDPNKTDAKSIADYANSHNFAGATASGQTVTFHLTQPATYFTNILAIPVFSPRPVEDDAYVPGSPEIAQHTISDGPYRVDSYKPGKSMTFVRNPVWDASTDPLRKAYVDKIILTMTNDPETTQHQLEANQATADLSQGGVIATDVPRLLANPTTKANLDIQPEIATNPYILYNTQSPNNNGALKNVKVRQAISYALNRAHILQLMGGPKIAPPLTHVLPPEIEGSESFDPYPYNVDKAKQLLQQANVKNLTLTYLYRPSSPTQVKIFQAIQADLKLAGITVKGLTASDADFYTKYLEDPNQAKQGVWDLSAAGWLPDWYGNAALSFFGPLFDGRALPPSSSNFGLFNDSKVNSLIDAAKAATSETESTKDWTAADHAVMDAAAFYPLSDPNAVDYHASQVHNTVYMAPFGGWDWTNVWLDKNMQGG